MPSSQLQDNRWELYKVLGERTRLRMLAALSEEELAIGELAEVLGESQPNVSRQLAPLRKLNLLSERKQGTRVFVRLSAEAARDAVIGDALGSGRALCQADGSLARIPEVVAGRDVATREFFAQSEVAANESPFPAELPAYLRAISPLLPRHRLALDVGTGDGRLLEVLAPLYDRVIGLDREQRQLDRAAERLRQRDHHNVSLIEGDLQDPALDAAVAETGGADGVFASRVLHHAPRPLEAVRRLADLTAPGGSLVVLDYSAHHDESMRDEQADLWLGFTPEDLLGYVAAAGLCDARVEPIPRPYCGTGRDRHLSWQMLTARRPTAPTSTLTTLTTLTTD